MRALWLTSWRALHAPLHASEGDDAAAAPVTSVAAVPEQLATVPTVVGLPALLIGYVVSNRVSPGPTPAQDATGMVKSPFAHAALAVVVADPCVVTL